MEKVESPQTCALKTAFYPACSSIVEKTDIDVNGRECCELIVSGKNMNTERESSVTEHEMTVIDEREQTGVNKVERSESTKEE